MNEVAKVPLPKTPTEWADARKIKSVRTLNDHVESIHIRLLDPTPIKPDEEDEAAVKRCKRYELLLDAVYDEEATEGSLSYDNFQAAAMVREYATSGGRDPYVADRKLSAIVKALNVILRRYGMSRKQRAKTLHGEEINLNGFPEQEANEV